MIIIDPHSEVYYEDKLFSMEDVVEGEDPSGPLQRLYLHLVDKGIDVHTADFLLKGSLPKKDVKYYAFNQVGNYLKLFKDDRVQLSAFFLMEPPAVAPSLYRALPKLTRYFDRVYVHNIIGDGYSLKGVDQSKLCKLYWPQPYRKVLHALWDNVDRLNRLVLINGNHIPRSFTSELYSKRIEAMVSLAKIGVVDLFGRGWSKWWSYHSMWPPYWFNYKTLMSIYQGSCESKYEVLSRYRYSLCFENMKMKGYVTEKIFDCFYAGTIPIYLGAPDIFEYVPKEAFIDGRKFGSWEDMWCEISKISEDEIQDMKLAGREFIEGAGALKYYNSLIEPFND